MTFEGPFRLNYSKTTHINGLAATREVSVKGPLGKITNCSQEMLLFAPATPIFKYILTRSSQRHFFACEQLQVIPLIPLFSHASVSAICWKRSVTCKKTALTF